MSENIKRILLRRCSDSYIKLLKKIGSICSKRKCKGYLVGGPVRDLLLGIGSKDIDIVVDGGDIYSIISDFAGKNCCQFYKEFGTAKVFLKKKQIDFAMARKEIYSRPGSLPQVTSAGIEDDLKRRDFTINAIAMAINPEDFGDLIDLFNGRKDIEDKILRVLHDKSFIDDPIRILRGARFVSRFDLIPARKTEELIRQAVRERYLFNVSIERIRDELLKILKEKNISKTIDVLQRWDVLKFIHPKLKLNDFIYKNISKDSEIGFRIAILLYNNSLRDIHEILNTLHFNRSLSYQIENVFRCIEGEVVRKELPSWAKKFYKIIKFDNRKILIDGKDLISAGLKPGPIFKEIMSDLLKLNYRTKKSQLEYAIEKYRKYLE